MDLLQVYSKVDEILNALDFNELFDGFHKYRFALYNREEIVLDGKVMPYQEDFRGNTAKEYEGEYIAIWDVGFDPVEDMERFAYCLVHEMFHCHQFTNKKNGYPNDLELLNYPEDVENFTRKYNEDRYLADAYERQDVEILRKFACIREKRFIQYPQVLSQEWKVEGLEGMAEYIGLKALERINPAKYQTKVRDYLGKLREESNLLFDVRRISYYVGAIYFLCMEQFGSPVSFEWDSELTIYEQNPIDVAGMTAEVFNYDFIANVYTRLTEEKEARLQTHMETSEYVECNGFVCGYDPMNMFRLGDMIYCSHFVLLHIDGEMRTINSAVVLKLAEGSNRGVIGYYI